MSKHVTLVMFRRVLRPVINSLLLKTTVILNTICGTRIPSPTEIGGIYQTTAGNSSYIVIGNSNLDEETSDAFEIGLRNTSIDGIKFDVTGFIPNTVT